MPSKDSMPKKKPIYTRKKKPTTQTPEGTTLLLLLLLVDHPIKNTSSLKHSALSPSEVTSPTSETPEPVAMETEVKTPAAEPGESGGPRRQVMGDDDDDD